MEPPATTLPGASEMALCVKFLLKKINEINGRIWIKTGDVGKWFSVDYGCIPRRDYALSGVVCER